MKPLKRVFVVWRPWLGAFQHALARELTDAGAKVNLYLHRSGDIDLVRRDERAGVYSHIETSQLIYDLACAPLNNGVDEVARAQAIEAWLGVTYGELLVPDRHLGRGFAVGAPLFPVSDQSRANYHQTLAALSGQIEFWKREIETYEPDLIVDCDYLAGVVARKMNVPVRITAASRHRNMYYWAENAFLETPLLKPAWQRRRNQEVATLPDVEPAAPISTYWQTAMKTARWSHPLKATAYQLAHRTYHRLKGTDLGPTYDIWSNIRYLWRFTRQTRQMIGVQTRRLSDLKDTPFVFFPLATEPEMTLQGLSPEYFFQLETIAALARDVPAGTMIAVKEHHPACGARADGFYDQISAFKNVVWLDMRERGVDVIRRAAATVTIAGSAGFEAAAMGKPVIVFGRHNIYDFLPHVHSVTDAGKLRSELVRALHPSEPAATREADGARFLLAVEEVSFDLGDFDPYVKGSKADGKSIAAAFAKLCSSLPAQQVDPRHEAGVQVA